ncbi:MAG: hypothetical protein JRD05_10015, partial [Deltaproteobacteria bacterium]|nr:hypothetical protein [Deltaproteobacteria bacterium]
MQETNYPDTTILTKSVTLSMPIELHKEFRQAARNANLTGTSLLRGLLVRY